MQSDYSLESDNGNYSIDFFEQNTKTKSDHMRIYLSENPPIFDTVTFFISNNSLLKYNSDNEIDTVNYLQKHGWSFRFFSWGISAFSDEIKIMISFSDSANVTISQSPISYDVLIILPTANFSDVKRERRFFLPKMSVWFTNETDVPKILNIYIPKPKDKFHVIKKGEKVSIVNMK
jgi:hypothetical protein